MKIYYRVIAFIYALITGILLIVLFPILWPLEKLNFSQGWLYKLINNPLVWLNKKYR